jgi:hypothetical protein
MPSRGALRSGAKALVLDQRRYRRLRNVEVGGPYEGIPRPSFCDQYARAREGEKG